MKKQFSVRNDKIRIYRSKNKLDYGSVLFDDLYELRELLQRTLKQIDVMLKINEMETGEIYKSKFDLK